MLTDHLIDTNVAFRRFFLGDKLHALVRSATDRLSYDGGTLWITPQVVVKVRALATRPVEANGLGMTSAQSRRLTERMERDFPLLLEMPKVYSHWKDLVDRNEVIGRQVYNARWVAVMLTH